MTTKERLLQEIEQASEPLLHEVLIFLLATKAHLNSDMASQPDPQTKAQTRPIWEIFEDFADSLPEDVKAQLPEDGATRLDHYLYSWPQQEL